MRKLLASALLTLIPAVASAGSVLTYHASNQRDGAYVVPTLTSSAAAGITLDTKFKPTISGHVYAQPLFWKPSGAKKGLVIVATESNSVYALNENSGKTVWSNTALGTPMPLSQLPCGNIDPMGITGTPVIDPATATLYFDTMTKTVNGARHFVHALSLADGSELSRWPIDIQQAIGGGWDSSVQGERSALLFFNGNLYVNYGGHFGDCGSYRGTVVQIDPSAVTVTANWQTRATGGGIWAQGGVASDGAFLFATTGNTFGTSKWMDGEAIIRLKPGLAHSTGNKDFFTPSNWHDLDNSDEDLGGTEAIPLAIKLPNRAQRVIAFGKDGNAYLADRNKLGGIGGQMQILNVSSSGIRTAPAVYEATDNSMVAFQSNGGGSCHGGNITMLNVAASGSTPMSVAWCAAFSGGGAPIVTTTDGTANALVWAVGAEGDNELHAFNALTGAVVFAGSGTAMSGLHHYQTILATDRRLYVAGDSAVYAFKF